MERAGDGSSQIRTVQFVREYTASLVSSSVAIQTRFGVQRSRWCGTLHGGWSLAAGRCRLVVDGGGARMLPKRASAFLSSAGLDELGVIFVLGHIHSPSRDLKEHAVNQMYTYTTTTRKIEHNHMVALLRLPQSSRPNQSLCTM